MGSIKIEDNGFVDIEVTGAGESRSVTIDVADFVDKWVALSNQHKDNPKRSDLIRAWVLENYGFPEWMSGHAMLKLLKAISDQYADIKKKDFPEAKPLPESQDSTESTHSS